MKKAVPQIIRKMLITVLSIFPYRKSGIVSRVNSDRVYWDWWIKREEIDRGDVPELYEKLIKEKGRSALDVGCGNGFYSRILKDSGYDVVCADRTDIASKGLIKEAWFQLASAR